MPILNLPRTSHGRGAAPVPNALACGVGVAAAAGLAAAIVSTTSIACTVAAGSAAGLTASIATTGRPGYSLPAAGAAVSIALNTADAVKPSRISSDGWLYANFQSWSGGVYASDYSAYGAWAIAGCGGHGAAGNMDSLIFDFADAMWKLLPNTASQAVDRAHQVGSGSGVGGDFINGGGELDGRAEVIAAQPAVVPAPSHLYLGLVYLPGAAAGNTKGALLRCSQSAYTTNPNKNGNIHRFDLDTGAWSYVGSSSEMAASNYYERNGFYDPSLGRVYLCSEDIHNLSHFQYLRLSDNTVQTSGGYGNPQDWTAGQTYHSVQLHHALRLWIDFSTGFGIRALNADNFAAGWTNLTEAGTRLGSSVRLAYHSGHGCFYGKTGNSGVKRLRPPASSPLTNAWTWEDVTFTGASLPNFPDRGNGSRHMSNLIYVSSLGCLAWVTPDAVVLCNPPNPNPVTTVNVTSAAASGTHPVSFGIAFAEGDVPGSITTDLANYQVHAMRTWPDGSLRHAVVAGLDSFTQNVAKTVTISRGTPPTGTNLTASDIQTAAPSASVQCGGLGTVNLSSLLASPVRTLYSGPQMVEVYYRGGIGAGEIQVLYYVRLYRGGRMRVQIAVENDCYLDNGSGALNSGTDRSYVPTVIVGGTTVFDNGGVSLSHPRNTRWFAEGWIAGDPQMIPLLNAAHLRATKMVPNHDTPPTDAVLNSFASAHTPMGLGDFRPDMSGTGYHESIGLLPGWCAAYIGSADARAYRAVIANALNFNTFPIAWRKKSDYTISTPSGFPTWTLLGPGGGGTGTPGTGRGVNYWEIAHHPEPSYLAFLITGDWWHYETMCMNAQMSWLTYNSNRGSGTSRLFYIQQVREMAWSLRTSGLLASLAPSSEMSSGIAKDHQDLVATNYTYLYNNISDGLSRTPTGTLFAPEYGNWNSVGSVPAFQWPFLIATHGYLSDTKPLASMTQQNAVRDWSYKWIEGLLGQSGVSTDYAYTRAGLYGITVATANNSTSWYSTWGEIFQATHGVPNDTASNTLTGGNIGNGNGGMDSYWGNLIPAVGYAKSHGFASAGYSRLTGASNWSTISGKFSSYPVWAVNPR